MEADSFRIAKVFSNGGDIHFRLPYFQREYAWGLGNWQTLLEDINDLYEGYQQNKEIEHFMGSLVVVQEGMVHGTVPVFKLVDGQQRLITISLILCALAESVRETSKDKYHKIRKYITNPDETGDYRYKLLPTTKYKDRETYQAILDGRLLDETQNGSKIREAYIFYRTNLVNKITSGEFEIDQLFLVLINCLQVVFINLSTGEKPYQIFESLNAKGKPLTQADLVRNYIAMKLPEDRQPEIFDHHWSKIEDMLQEKRTVGKSGLGELTAFLRHYLAFRSTNLCTSEHVYERFRDRVETDFNTAELFEGEVITLQRFAGFYNSFLRPESVSDAQISNALTRLNTLEMATGYPFLLAINDAYESNQITKEQFLEGLSLLENYMVRRYLAGEPTSYLNKAFPTFWRDIDPSDFVPSLKEVLMNHNYPADYAVRQKGSIRSFYENSSITRAKTTLVLETINRQLSLLERHDGYTVLGSSPTIEHILPQTLSEAWVNELGERSDYIYNQYINTLGNLTLVTAEWNAELSNSPFAFKKGKLADHILLLNHQYFNRTIPRWDDHSIQERANFLLDRILEIWPAIGEIQAPPSTSGRKPVLLKFLGQEYPVNTWRDVAEKTTEVVIQRATNFEMIAPSMPSYLSKEPFPISFRTLSNGWQMNTNLSSYSLQNYCRNLITAAGLTPQSWEVELH